MAKYNLNNINYISVGKSEKIFNIDMSISHKEVKDNALGAEREVQDTVVVIKTDQGPVLFSVPTFQKAKDKYYNKNATLNNKTFIADIDDDTVIGSGESNKFSLESAGESNQIRIHPLYDMDDICIKSSIKKIKNSSAEYKNKSEDYVDIYVPDLSDGILDFCQMDNYAYCLSKRTNKGPTMLATDLYDQTKTQTPEEIEDNSYHWKLKSNELKTFIYNTLSDMYEDDQGVLSNYYKPKYNLNGIKYNYVIEVPQNLPAGVYNDYESGDIQGDIFQAKNVYDSNYSMKMDDLSSLSETRDYIGMSNCGDKVFLKYFDNIDYTLDIVKRQKGSPDVVQDVGTHETVKEKYPFQKIETLDSINRFRSNIRHKSPLYSLKISNSGLNNIPEQDRTRIKNDIKNNIREMTRRLCPATTQLFDIFFDN